MEGADTASLRGAAPTWSLAGDKQLLDILQNIHQSLVTRCQEVNKKLDEMVMALDGASVDLQNVNNKFMALSNSQFIESRVYDDDVDIAPQEPVKEPAKPQEQAPELASLKRSVAALVSAHDTIEILPSDSDDEDDARLVLKPKDMYEKRPLPHIIGSQPWRNKWHAGLHPEDSDSDSSISKREQEDEEYSDSEPEMTVSAPAQHREREESTASSELASEQDIGSLPVAMATAPVAKPTPSDIAAELARRLGGQQIPIPAPEFTAPSPASQKVYKPEQPTTGTIFPDEPPPLDVAQSDDSAEDDIFAELRKSAPYTHSDRAQSRLADDLFGGLGEADVFDDFRETQASSTPASKQKAPLFADEPEPELFADKPDGRAKQDTATPDVDVKKPIGGISLFGNKQGAESIGAAILKRNRRKSSTDEEIVEQTPKQDEKPTKNPEKDIFDDLFAKSEKEHKRSVKKVQERTKKEAEVVKSNVDLFSDNIFDDIDDIFTTNVVKSAKSDANKTSLFDDDEDIFSDIAVTKDSKVGSKIVDKNTSIFESDDELFSETVNKVEKQESIKETKNIEQSTVKTQSYVLENEIDDLFMNKNDNNSNNNDVSHIIPNTSVNSEIKADIFNKIDTSSENKDTKIQFNKNIAAKSIFDDEDDDNDDLFASTNTKSSTDQTATSFKVKENVSSLFDDDSDENDLFCTKNNNDTQKELSINNNDSTRTEKKTELSKNTSLFDDLETNDIFATNKEDDNTAVKSHSQIDSNVVKETESLKSLSKSSSFDDDEESLFGETSKKTTQNKSKPEIMKKPTIMPRNNIGNKKSDANIPKNNKIEIKNDNKIKENNNKEIPQKNISEEPLPSLDQSIISLKEQNFESKLAQEENITPSTQKTKRDLIEETIEPTIPVIEDRPVEFTKQSKVDLKEEQIESVLPVVEPITSMIEEKPIDDSTQRKLDSNEQRIESILPHTEVPPIEIDDDIFGEETINNSSNEVINTPNVFDDIFSEPPAFEKSKEPKKSKNINALFDDDSEDEALFFKKNDPVLDEKPDLSTEFNKDALFGLFHDEPPAIEVDFTQKTSNNSENDDFLKTDSDDELFSTKTPNTTPKIPEIEAKIEENVSIKNKEIIPKEKPTISEKPQPEKPMKESQKDTTDGEPKKVGKLKTMNFNIDVSTLLPGASPKKKALEAIDNKNNENVHKSHDNVHKTHENIHKTQENIHIQEKKSLEQTDGQILAKSSEELSSKEKIEPMMVKSVSFEGEPDSQVLDNKISKERAKIQVKRRPSTRRARKEAVRKSAIDFGDDSTDNSSSIDDSPRDKPRTEQNDSSVDKEVDNIEVTRPELEENAAKVDDFVDAKSEIDFKLPKNDENQDVLNINTTEDRLAVVDSKIDLDIAAKDVNTNIESKSNQDELDSIINVNERTKTDEKSNKFEPTILVSDTIFKTSTKKETTRDSQQKSQVETNVDSKSDSPKTVTSKIVYILNDEDIFSTPAKSIAKSTDEDLFKNIANTSKTNEDVANINTLGNSYKNTNKNDQKDVKKSLFDDLSDDDELFHTNKKVASKPKGILDSDSEEDLFGGKRKDTKTTMEKEKKKVEVKSSLFGDEDDDGDLFGAKVKSKTVSSSQPTRSTREGKPAEPTFEDPLSMLGDDD